MFSKIGKSSEPDGGRLLRNVNYPGGAMELGRAFWAGAGRRQKDHWERPVFYEGGRDKKNPAFEKTGFL